MKKIFTLALLMSFSAMLMAQAILVQGKKYQGPLPVNSVKTPTDTVKPYGILNSTAFTVYSYISGTTNVGYVFGTNNQTKAQAQVFPLTQSYFVEEVLIWAIKKDTIGTPGMLTVTINIANATGTASTGVVTTAPGAVLSTTSISNADIDTSGFITVIPFAGPVYVSSSYAIVLDYTNFGNDSLAIVSCTAGDPGNNESSWVKLNNNTWRTIKKLFSANIDMYLLVVTDQSTAGINSPEFFEGMKFSAYPNPASSNVSIEYELEKAARVKMQIFDSHGKTVMNIDEFEQSNGKHSFELNTVNLKSGNYYVSFEVNGKKLTKKLLVNN